MVHVGDKILITVPLDGKSSGIVYAKYFFSDGASFGRTIVLAR
jgi:hypothetical protein